MANGHSNCRQKTFNSWIFPPRDNWQGVETLLSQLGRGMEIAAGMQWVGNWERPYRAQNSPSSNRAIWPEIALDKVRLIAEVKKPCLRYVFRTERELSLDYMHNLRKSLWSECSFFIGRSGSYIFPLATRHRQRINCTQFLYLEWEWGGRSKGSMNVCQKKGNGCLAVKTTAVY